MKPNPKRRDPSIYPFSFTVPVRFGDMDIGRHVNNVAIAQFHEDGRVSFNRKIFGHLETSAAPDSRARILVAQVNITYLAEGHYPGEILIAAGAARLGRTSFGLATALFQGDRCISLAESTVVHTGGRGPEPLPEWIREGLARHMLPESAL